MDKSPIRLINSMSCAGDYVVNLIKTSKAMSF